MADGVAILDDVLALGEIFQCHLMAGGHVFFQSDDMTIYRDGFACFKSEIATTTLSAGLIFKYFVSISILVIRFTFYVRPDRNPHSPPQAG